MAKQFWDLRSDELADAAHEGCLIILPIGQVEQHGPHLPVSTDVDIAVRLAERAADLTAGEVPTLVMPPIWAGFSGRAVARWPGTIRVRTRVVMDLTLDICRSVVEMGFRKLVLVTSHGQHTAMIETVARELADVVGAYAAVVPVAKIAADAVRRHRRSELGGCLHAGEFETSLMLHFGRPVDMSRASAQDRVKHHSRFLPGDAFPPSGGRAYVSTWGMQRSETGAYGDPTVATRETGAAIFEETAAELAAFLREYYQLPPQPS
jgi:creatinine amidohydrolase